jgi:hypothetical protein
VGSRARHARYASRASSDALLVLEHDREIEARGDVVGALGERGAVVRLGIGEAAGLVIEAAEVQVRVGVRGRERERARVARARAPDRMPRARSRA